MTTTTRPPLDIDLLPEWIREQRAAGCGDAEIRQACKLWGKSSTDTAFVVADDGRDEKGEREREAWLRNRRIREQKSAPRQASRATLTSAEQARYDGDVCRHCGGPNSISGQECGECR